MTNRSAVALKGARAASLLAVVVALMAPPAASAQSGTTATDPRLEASVSAHGMTVEAALFEYHCVPDEEFGAVCIDGARWSRLAGPRLRIHRRDTVEIDVGLEAAYVGAFLTRRGPHSFGPLRVVKNLGEATPIDETGLRYSVRLPRRMPESPIRLAFFVRHLDSNGGTWQVPLRVKPRSYFAEP
jgi:hypothetical protein